MTKAETSKFDELTSMIDDLRSLNAQLTLRVISLETKAEPTERRKGDVTETKGALLNKVPMNAQVSAAGQNEDGSWYITLDGTQTAATKYCAEFWVARLAPKKEVGKDTFAKINAEKQRLIAAGTFNGAEFSAWANAQLAA